MKVSEKNEPPALTLLEEAMRLLRGLPPGLAALYLAGVGPFLLGFIFFWNQMSRHPHAMDKVLVAAMGLAFLFFWMRTVQAIFSASLLRLAEGSEPPRLRPAGLARVFVRQTAWQGWGVPVFFVAALIALPLGWVWAFLQGAAVMQGDPERPSASRREIWEQGLLWPRQNHFLLLVLSCWFLMLWLNLLLTGLVLPGLLSSLLGLDTPFSRNIWAMFNSTFLLSVTGVAYLGFDPLLRAVYALRIFYGRSRATGEDLLVRMRWLSRRGAAVTVGMVLLLGPVLQMHAGEFDPNGAAPAPGSAEEQVREADHALKEVTARPEFAWRLPIPKTPTENSGWLAGFFRDIGKIISGWMQALFEAIQRIVEWFFDFFSGDGTPAATDSAWDWQAILKVMVAVLLAVAVILAVAFAVRKLRRRNRPLDASALPANDRPDLEDEATGAEALPESGWLEMARAAAARGEWRVALRAVFLAMLAHMGDRQLVVLARHKTNRDYERELQSRVGEDMETLQVLRRNRRLFEASWYGTRPSDHRIFESMLSDLETLRSQ